jgi:hypothetical protein
MRCLADEERSAQVVYTGLDHIGFAVSSLDRSVDWYSFLLDEPPILRKVWDVEYVSRIVGYPRSGWSARSGSCRVARC